MQKTRNKRRGRLKEAGEEETVCACVCVLCEGLGYFLALPPLAAFLGGVTGRPDPYAPAPLYANIFLSAGFKI